MLHLQTDSTARCVAKIPISRDFLPRDKVLELAIERASIQQFDGLLGRFVAEQQAMHWALVAHGVPLCLLDGELAIDTAACERAAEFVVLHREFIEAAGIEMKIAHRAAAVELARREMGVRLAG